jgi:hypothetical protein
MLPYEILVSFSVPVNIHKVLTKESPDDSGIAGVIDTQLRSLLNTQLRFLAVDKLSLDALEHPHG